MFNHIQCLAMAGLLAAGAATAHVGPLDPSFGDGGMRHYSFQPVAGDDADRAFVACPGADGTLTVLGAASGGRRIVTVRLRNDGSYDPAFSSDGKESFDFPATLDDFTPGLCQRDGNLVIAHAATAPDGEQNLRILRVRRSDGLPDATFGSGGVATVDLDQWTSGLGRIEMPLGINQLANGDIAVSGIATLAPRGSRGFVAVLAANGSVRVAAVLSNLRSYTVTTVVDAPDGRLWVFGQNGRAYGSYRATLDRATLAWQGVLEHPAAADQWIGAGRAVDAQTVVLATSTGPSVNAPGQPQLIVFRATSASTFALPAASLDGTAHGVLSTYGTQGVTVLPQRRVLYAAITQTATGADVNGLHFALAELGADAGGDRIDTTFGIGGAQTASFRPAAPACAGAAQNQRFGRLTAWSARPVYVGAVDASCTGPERGEDYLVARIRTDAIFAAGLD